MWIHTTTSSNETHSSKFSFGITGNSSYKLLPLLQVIHRTYLSKMAKVRTIVMYIYKGKITQVKYFITQA